MVELPVEDCPAHFFIGFPSDEARTGEPWQHGWQLSAGRALSRDLALLATRAEAAERMSLWSRGPADPARADPNRDKMSHLPSNRFLRFSRSQLAQLSRVLPPGAFAIGPEEIEPRDSFPIAMSRLRDGETVALSAVVALFGDEFRYLPGRQLSSSSGTAAWSTFEGALERAVLELVERDAVACWWYNRLPAARLPTRDVLAAVDPRLAAWLDSRARRLRVLLLPTDLPAVAVAALSFEPDGSAPACGFSAGLTAAETIQSAILEMVQGELSLRHMRLAQTLPDAPAVPPLLAWSKATDVDAADYLRGASELRGLPSASSFDALRAAFDRTGIDIYYADLTRSELGVPVARAVSPQLRDWSPRFAPGRLYDLPVSLGIVDRPLTEPELAGPFIL